MQNPALHPPLEGDALNNTAAYRRDYAASLENSEAFWAKESARLDWMTPWDEVVDAQFTPPVSIRWFSGGMLNVSANCLDRHLAARPEKTAILWEGDDAAEVRRITYRELHADVCRFANVLKSLNVQKGDRVTIYMPMIPEAAVAMLACTRIGAVHSVVFGGFSAEALQNRIVDCGSNLLITADEGRRGGKSIPLKANADRALASLPNVKDVIVIRRTGGKIEWEPSRDRWYDTLMAQASPDCAPEPLASEDPLFLLYTSGSTGKPKGVLHTTAGYLLYAAFTHQAVFDLREEDVYWCTADIGWVTGHSYVLYGPLANGATTLMFEGVPNYPDASRFWQIIDRHKVSSFYTAPTAIRALMREGEAFVKASSRASLRILGSVGEPINPEAWRWFHEKVGERRCPIMDTWWQTETGGILITPLPHATPLKPGSATWPFYGVEPVLLNDAGRPLEGEGEGVLCIKRSWPGQARSIYGDHARFEATYFMPYPGYYFSGDGCRRDADGYYWITGRVDDVINVSGHRLGTAEIESALVAHSQVAEAAVVGMPHAIKGQGIYAFVSLNANATSSPELEKELKNWVRSQIGAIASPDLLQFASALPKTRSGKIMRRLLRKIAEGAVNDLGDVSTLADPETVNELINSRLTPTGN